MQRRRKIYILRRRRNTEKKKGEDIWRREICFFLRRRRRTEKEKKENIVGKKKLLQAGWVDGSKALQEVLADLKTEKLEVETVLT